MLFLKGKRCGMLPSLEARHPPPKSNLQLSSQCGTAPRLTEHLGESGGLLYHGDLREGGDMVHALETPQEKRSHDRKTGGSFCASLPLPLFREGKTKSVVFKHISSWSTIHFI